MNGYFYTHEYHYKHAMCHLFENICTDLCKNNKSYIINVVW
jgi:hypothetical protein